MQLHGELERDVQKCGLIFLVDAEGVIIAYDLKYFVVGFGTRGLGITVGP